MEIPKKMQRVLAVLGILLGGVVLTGIFFYVQLTADVDPSVFESTNRYDAKEARKKMQLLDDSRAVSKPGWVRFAEVEINSFIDSKSGAFESSTGKTNVTPSTSAISIMRRCRVDVTITNLTVCSWITHSFLGRKWELALTRSAELRADGAKWELVQTGWQLGRQRITWEWARRMLDDLAKESDNSFEKEFRWFRAAPAVALKPAAWTNRPELLVYNYADTNALKAARN